MVLEFRHTSVIQHSRGWSFCIPLAALQDGWILLIPTTGILQDMFHKLFVDRNCVGRDFKLINYGVLMHLYVVNLVFH